MRVEGVNWGLLTNGTFFEIFKRRTESSRPDEVRLGRVAINDLAAEYELVRTLTKEYIETGESQRVAQSNNANMRSSCCRTTGVMSEPP